MPRLATLLALPCLAPLAAAKQSAELRQLADRAAIEEVMQKYIWSVDSLDADGYVSVFTEDAVIEQPNSVEKGRDAIRRVVTGLQQRRAANLAAGKPPGNLYHVISNERISFQSATEATYQSYWQTMRKGEDGRWLIRYRKLVVFTD